MQRSIRHNTVSCYWHWILKVAQYYIKMTHLYFFNFLLQVVNLFNRPIFTEHSLWAWHVLGAGDIAGNNADKALFPRIYTLGNGSESLHVNRHRKAEDLYDKGFHLLDICQKFWFIDDFFHSHVQQRYGLNFLYTLLLFQQNLWK